MDERARARLIEDHLDVARRAAGMIYPRVREHIELEELVALGNAGLVESASRYDPDRGTSFETFAWYRVQGAIIDGLRRMTQMPRRVWAKLIALRAASEYLEHRAERDLGATKAGTPVATGADALAQVKSALSAIRTMYVCSLDGMREEGFDASAPPVDVGAKIDGDRRSVRIREALHKLPERERALMQKHYWEGKNIMEAGKELGISKSWASRMHAQAVEKIRVMLDEDGS